MSGPPALDDEELQKIYVWVDSVPLSRPKRNISRDFSDGVLAAEMVAHYFPKLVELHNYSSANSLRQKLYNWATLNQKVFRRLNFDVKKSEIESIVNCKPGVIESILMQLQHKIAEYRAALARGETSPLPYTAPPDSARGGGGQGGSGGFGSSQDSSGGHLSDRGAQAGAAIAAAAAAHPRGSTGYNGGPQTSAYVPVTHLGGGHAVAAPAPYAGDAEKDATIGELRETIEILELKIKKLEQLVRLKDSRIQTLTQRLQGGAPPTSGAAGFA